MNANNLAVVVVKILVVFAKLDYGFAIFYKEFICSNLCDIVKLQNPIKPS